METINLNQKLKPIAILLTITFGIVPIVAGLDKFTNFLTQWENYLNPGLVDMIPFTPHTFMIVVGIIEIIAGVIVFMRTTIGGYIVSAWLTLIAITLILGGTYLDIAVRDLVMAICAFSLARIAKFISVK